MQIDHEKRSRYKGLVLYPDNIAHKMALDIINASWCYKGILHDKDTDANGEPKKAHWHIIVQLDTPQSDYYLSERLDIPVNYIEQIVSVKSAYDYLTHRYHPDKYQYEDENLFGDLILENENINNSRFEQFIELIKQNNINNPKQLTQLAIDFKYIDVLKKNSYLLLQIIKGY